MKSLWADYKLPSRSQYSGPYSYENEISFQSLDLKTLQQNFYNYENKTSRFVYSNIVGLIDKNIKIIDKNDDF